MLILLALIGAIVLVVPAVLLILAIMRGSRAVAEAEQERGTREPTYDPSDVTERAYARTDVDEMREVRREHAERRP